MINPEINFEKIKNIFTWRRMRKSIFEFISRRTGAIIIFAAIFLLGYSVYLWHNYIYKPQWSEEKKKEYIKSKGEEVVFDEKGFEEIVLEFETRKSESQKEAQDLNDIFRLKN